MAQLNSDAEFIGQSCQPGYLLDSEVRTYRCTGYRGHQHQRLHFQIMQGQCIARGETTKILILNVAAPRKAYVHTARPKPQFRLSKSQHTVHNYTCWEHNLFYYNYVYDISTQKKTMYMTFEKLSVSSKATTEQTMRTLPH